jgi:hypothetical protein
MEKSRQILRKSYKGHAISPANGMKNHEKHSTQITNKIDHTDKEKCTYKIN